MITCTRFEQMFPEAVSGKLSNIEAEEFAEHRRQCPDCARFTEADAYFRMRMQTVAYEPNVPPLRVAFNRERPVVHPERRNVFAFRTLSLAAGIVAGVLIVGSVLNRTTVLTPVGAGGNTFRAADTVHQTPPTQQWAAADTHSAKTNDSIKTKNGTQPIPQQFPGDLQTVSGGK